MKEFKNWTLEELKEEAAYLKSQGYDKFPDYAGVDKYDWTPHDARYRREMLERYLAIIELIQKRMDEMSE